MPSIQESAILSLYVYAVRPEAVDENRPRLPTGWFPEPDSPVKDDANGFSYGVFRHTSGKEVVAYTGTNQGVDWVANIGNGVGASTAQTNMRVIRVRSCINTSRPLPSASWPDRCA